MSGVKFFLAPALVYAISISMCLRFFSFGISSTIFPFVLGFLICIFSFLVIRLDFKSYAITAFLLFLAFVHSSITNLSIDHVFKIATLTLLFFCCHKLTKKCEDKCKLLNNFVIINIIFLSLEFFGRIFFGDNFRSEDAIFVESNNIVDFLIIGFYKYKLGSPFFLDSNFAAIHGLLLLFFLLHFRSYIFNLRIKLYWLSLIILATFSRAAIVCLLLVFLVFYFRRLKILTKIYFGILIFFFLFLSIYFIIDDWSLQTKFTVWKKLLDHDFGLVNLFFGYGVNDGKYVFGWDDGFTSHSLIPSLIGEYGFLGMSIYVSILLIIGHSIFFNRYYFFIIIMILGFSLFDPFEPLLFVMSGIATALNRERSDFCSTKQTARTLDYKMHSVYPTS
jgi:hypothetical protein